MTVEILSKKNFPAVEDLRNQYNIFRALDIKSRDNLEAVEFINTDGVFRGFGKNTKKAFKNATQVIESYYNKKSA